MMGTIGEIFLIGIMLANGAEGPESNSTLLMVMFCSGNLTGVISLFLFVLGGCLVGVALVVAVGFLRFVAGD